MGKKRKTSKKRKEISDAAREFCRKSPSWTARSDAYCCKIMDRLEGSNIAVAAELNKRKICRGSYRGGLGKHLWTGQIASHVYRTQTGITLRKRKKASLGKRGPKKKVRLGKTEIVAKKALKVLEHARTYLTAGALQTATGYNDIQLRRALHVLITKGKVLRRGITKGTTYRAKNVPLKKDAKREEARKQEYKEKPAKSRAPQRRVRKKISKHTNHKYFDLRSWVMVGPTRLRIDFTFEADLTDATAVKAINSVLAASHQQGAVEVKQLTN